MPFLGALVVGFWEGRKFSYFVSYITSGIILVLFLSSKDFAGNLIFY
jgi:hypothetical protein